MTARRRLPTLLCFGLGLLLGLPACSVPKRLVTVPPGAKVYFPRLGHGGLVTPMDVSADVRTTDTIRVVKEGFETWEGQLRQLWQETEGCYKLRLKRVN